MNDSAVTAPQQPPLVSVDTVGGAITALFAAGRQWLLPDVSERSSRRAQQCFIGAGMGGWDECAPTVAPCTLPAGLVPDHGWAWLRTWQPASGGWWNVALGPERSPADLLLQRRIAAVGAELVLDYRAVNNGPATPFAWAAHPQFRARDITVQFCGPRPATAQWVRAVVVGPEGERSGGVVRGTWDALWADVPAGGGGKYYLRGACEAVVLRHASGAALELRWTGAPVGHLGVWIDRGLYAREDVVAIEPATAGADSAADAAAAGECLVLPANSGAEWRMVLGASRARG